MDFLEAIILGIIQGVTEFLPVSSSGHIELAKAIFGTEENNSMTMTVVLHFATALSTCFVFRKDLIDIFKGLFKFKNNTEFQFSLKIILSMIPAAIVGILYDDLIETFFSGKILLVGIFLILTGLILFVADKAKATAKNITFTQAIIIGVSQAIAILPGISRSGATISTSVLLGIDREKAARFSFLMVIPLIFGKIIKDIMSDKFNLEPSELLFLTIGFVFAFFTGLIACKLMIKLVKNSKLYYFSFYCFIIGTIVIIYTLLQ
jgi:undecaprenyl-diphosphatase